MRILKILNSNDDGGVLTCETQFIARFKELGIIVDGIILGKGCRYEYYREMVDNYYEVPSLDVTFNGGVIAILRNIMKSAVYGISNSKKVFKELNIKDYDCIIYRRVNLLFFAGLLGKKTNTKVFWFMPNIIGNRFSYFFFNFFLRVLKIVPIANSIYTQKTLGKLCKNVVYPGFDPRRLSIGKEIESSLRESLNIYDRIVIGIIARVTSDKAQDIVIEAFLASEIYKNKGCLIIAGGLSDTEFVEKLKKIAGDELNKSIFLIGSLVNVSYFYNGVDIVINGRRNAEPFGISIAEGLGAGKPIIAYSLGGPSEMIVEGVNGWFASAPTVESYKQAFDNCYRNISSWRQIGETNVIHSEKFSVKTNVDKFINIIAGHK